MAWGLAEARSAIKELYERTGSLETGRSDHLVELHRLHERINALETALDTARATAPVSDDEIIEALAKALYREHGGSLRFDDLIDASRGFYLDRAQSIRAQLVGMNLDVVKRS